MPLATKLLFLAVGLGLTWFVVLAFMHGATRRPTPTRSRIEPIGKRRYDHLWVVDRDDDRWCWSVEYPDGSEVCGWTFRKQAAYRAAFNMVPT